VTVGPTVEQLNALGPITQRLNPAAPLVLEHPITGDWYPNTSARIDLQDDLDFITLNLNQLVQILVVGFDGLGDVVGPNSAIPGNVACYADATGKLIEDGLKACAELVCQPDPVTDETIPRMNGITGQLMQPSGVTISDTDLVDDADGYGMTLNVGSPFAGGQYGLWIDNQFSTALVSYSSAGTHWTIPFVSLSGINDGDQIAWNDVAKSWQLVAGGGGATVPVGTVEDQYLSWDAGGAAWIALRRPFWAFSTNTQNSGLAWANYARIDNEFVTADPTIGVLWLSTSGTTAFPGGCSMVMGQEFWGGTGAIASRTFFFSGGTIRGSTHLMTRNAAGALLDRFSCYEGVAVSWANVDANALGILDVGYTGAGAPPALTAGYGIWFIRDGLPIWRTPGGVECEPCAGGLPGSDVVENTSTDGSEMLAKSNENTIVLPGSGSAPITLVGALIPGTVMDIRITVKVAIGVTNGLTGIQFGDGTDVDRYGVLLAANFAKNDFINRDGWTVPNEVLYGIYVDAGAFPKDIVLTVLAGAYDGGEVTITVHLKSSTVITYV
jgi:hypothetical protein